MYINVKYFFLKTFFDKSCHFQVSLEAKVLFNVLLKSVKLASVS